MSTPPPAPSLTRRTVLLGLTAAGLTACTPSAEKPPPPDPLAALVTRARADAATATAIAAAVPTLATPAGLVAAARAEHADTLQQEIDRASPPKPSSSTAPTPPPPKAPTDPTVAKKALADGLTGATEEATKTATQVPRYRAGMVGSIAAGCASLLEVLA
ncbi:hypothetical protein [Actinokineospora inagensis]|uniref:hypothetical protein n=1 Tax=Actinokineospora inagensis TaxID=103730 RepID=UPI000418B477|nr:hypothetical protein [Actinokineospora inagensis]